MSTINYAFKEVSCKIVYYGPGLCGKTTNLIKIHETVPGKFRGDLVSLATETDRTLFFDFLPLDLGEIKGFKTKFQLYTVPGQVFYNATRKLVLRGVDGIVFVADSAPDRLDDNVESNENMRTNLAEYGLDLTQVPCVYQFNKRDLPEALAIEKLQSALNPDGAKHFEAVAVNGVGVSDTLKSISAQVLKKLQSATADAPSSSVGLPPRPAPAAPKPAARPAPAPAPPRPVVDNTTPPPRPKPGMPPAAKSLNADTQRIPKLDTTPAKPAPAAEAETTAAAKSGPLPMAINQICDVYWRSFRVGRAQAELRPSKRKGGPASFDLVLDIKLLGLIGRRHEATMRHVGREIRDYEDRDARFETFASYETMVGTSESSFAWICNEGVPVLFARYYGSLSELLITPQGKGARF